MNKMRLSLAVVIILSSWAGSVPAMAGDEHSPDANVAVEQHESAPSISTQESGVDQRIIIDGIDLSEVVLQQDVIEVIAPTAQALPLPAKPNHVVIDMSMFDYCDELFYPEDRTAAPSLLSVDSTFVKSILNFKEVVCPMTKRKAAMWLGFAALGGGIAALETTVGFSEYIMQAVQYNSTALMAVIYGLEPLFSLFDLAVAKYPEAGKLPDPAVGTPGAEEIALVIPAHNSAGIIKKTLKAALKHLKPEQIFVVDNGSGEMPSDNTADKIKAVNPGIHYIYQAIPNKTIAQYAGTMAASKLGYKYIMTTDDDVRLPENFDFCTNRINDEVKAVCFPIRAVSPDGKPSILVNWQDVEYQASDLAKLAEDRFGVTQYPHGAGSLWETDTFLDILKNHHDTVFHGEDMKLGFGLADKGKRMAMCSATTLDTDAPTSVLGKGANYFRQRVRCWEMTRHTMFGKALLNLISPFSKGAKNSVMGTLVKKKAQFTLVVGTTSDWLRIPLTVIMATNPNYWIKLGAFNAVAAVSPLLLNYAGPLDKRPDLKANLGGVISYPVYKLLYSAVSVAGALRAVLIYTPNFKRQPTIKELEEMKDPRCVWLNEGECQQITQAQ